MVMRDWRLIFYNVTFFSFSYVMVTVMAAPSKFQDFEDIEVDNAQLTVDERLSYDYNESSGWA